MNNLKQSLLVLLICLSFGSSLLYGQKVYQIEGNIEGLEEQEIVIQYVREGLLLRDTVKSNNGFFHYSLAPVDGNMASILFKTFEEFDFWLEQPVVSISGKVTSDYNLFCFNTPENIVLDLYKKTIHVPYNRALRLANSNIHKDSIINRKNEKIYDFIKANSNTLTAAYLLYVQTSDITNKYKKLQSLLSCLNDSVQDDYWAKKAKSRISNFHNRPQIGEKLPEFSLISSLGKPISLSSFKGKPLLIDFWGTWCAPCMRSIPELKRIHNKYRSRLFILSVAKEKPNAEQKWRNIIAKNSMLWIQAVEFTSSKDGIIELYNVTKFPTMLLANSDGFLVDYIVYGESTEKKVDTFFKKWQQSNPELSQKTLKKN